MKLMHYPKLNPTRYILLPILIGIMLVGFASIVNAAEIMHPMKDQKQFTKGNCPNCGMMLNMWARTRHTFTLSEGNFETCSIRCMADFSQKAGENPQNVNVAIYHHPEKMIPAEKAIYVIGSDAKGAMTMKSKIAFGSKDEVEKFVGSHGGKVENFSKTLTMATSELEKSRPKIAMKRKKMGKIKEPSKDDHCVECGMYPARYPEHRSQILTADGKTLHFCSTKCMTNYMIGTDESGKKQKIASIWVTVYPDGGYEYAKGLYYVVGSKIMGPMGSEPLPFRMKADAQKFAQKNGGKVMRFEQVKNEMREQVLHQEKHQDRHREMHEKHHGTEHHEMGSHGEHKM